MKKILVVNGHPDQQSFNYALSEAYIKGASESNHLISKLNLSELQFNPNLAYGYRERMELEPDLQMALDKIKSADHIVWFFPMWWYSVPALMKGFIDRTFLPGITFESIEGKALPRGLLKGKSARMVITADTPQWYDRIYMKRPAINQIKKGTLQFCGIKPVKVSYLTPINGSSTLQREKWLQKLRDLGRRSM